jgi:hypothetical protein
MAVAFLSLFLVIARGSACGAIGDLMALDGKLDAGLYAGQGAFARLVGADPKLPLYVDPNSQAQFTSALQVYNYVSQNSISGDWLLESAGNIWSSDLIVGESLTDLSAGVYRISVADGAFRGYQYDSFGWSNDRDLWWWELHIWADNAYNNGQIVDSHYMLGSTTPFSSRDSAFQAAQGSYVDIALAQGGALNFWIYDINSIDNSGGLNFTVTRVPEPSVLMLLAMGLPALLWRARR